MKLISSFLIAIAAIISPFAAFAQSDTAIYQKSVYSPGVFSSKWEDPQSVTYAVTRSGEQQVYKASDFQIFDASSFALTVGLVKNDYVLQATTDKPQGYTVGMSWKTAFVSPPRQGSRCPNDITFDFTSKVTDIKQQTVQVGGKEQTVEVVYVSQEGTWSAPNCGNGRGAATIAYAPALKLMVQSEVVGYHGSTLVTGTRLSLKSLAQAPAAGQQVATSQ